METKEKICTCGCEESMHVDGCEQCFNGDCGCKEFEDATCEFCDGTGEVAVYESNESTGYNSIVSDTKPCICQQREEEYDNQE